MNSIDVIVPAFNEEKSIGACLQALTHQTFSGKYRIIVIVNNSTDDTKKIAQSFPGVIVKSEKRKGYVFAVKTGVERYSDAPIVAQTDADTIVDSHWLEEISKAFLNDSNLVACGGPFYFTDGPRVFRFLVNGLNFAIPSIINSHLCGMNMAYRRSSYDKIHGYDPSINIGADTLLGIKLMKLGKILIQRNQIVYGSARRYNSMKNIFYEVPSQIGNFLSLLIFKRPFILQSTDYRS